MRKNIVKAFVSVALSVMMVIPCGIPTGALQTNWDDPKEQPDGEKLELMSNLEVGGLIYLSDIYGYVVVQNPITGYYVYAHIKDKKFVPGNVVVTEETINSFEDLDRVDISDYFAAQDMEGAEFPADYRGKEIEITFMEKYRNGEPIDAEPMIIDNCIMIPFRACADGYMKEFYERFRPNKTPVNDIQWNGELQEVTAKIAEQTDLVRFRVGDNKAYIGARECNLTVAPVNINGTVYMPLRFGEKSFMQPYYHKKIKDGKVVIYYLDD